jgi:hypothetical protein
MRGTILLMMACTAAFGIAERRFGTEAATLAAMRGAAALALPLAAAFVWLWLERATPLALGLALSWAGSGALLGICAVTQSAAGAHLLTAIYGAGAVLHLRVVAQITPWPAPVYWGAIGGAALVAARGL